MSTRDDEHKRKDRTIVLPLGTTLDEYQALIETEAGLKQLIRRVEVADRFHWGPLADGHEAERPRRHRFTHHDGYERGLKHYGGDASQMTIVRVRCLDCGAVFSVLPAFVVRYQRYDTDAIEKVMVELFPGQDRHHRGQLSHGGGGSSLRDGSAARRDLGGVGSGSRAEH